MNETNSSVKYQSYYFEGCQWPAPKMGEDVAPEVASVTFNYEFRLPHGNQVVTGAGVERIELSKDLRTTTVFVSGKLTTRQRKHAAKWRKRF